MSIDFFTTGEWRIIVIYYSSEKNHVFSELFLRKFNLFIHTVMCDCDLCIMLLNHNMYVLLFLMKINSNIEIAPKKVEMKNVIQFQMIHTNSLMYVCFDCSTKKKMETLKIIIWPLYRRAIETNVMAFTELHIREIHIIHSIQNAFDDCFWKV